MLRGLIITGVFFLSLLGFSSGGTNPVVSDPEDLEVDSLKLSIRKQNAKHDSVNEQRHLVTDSAVEMTDYILDNDSLMVFGQSMLPQETDQEWVKRNYEFVPDPKRAVWLSALFPGLGQIYNRRYWKLPILVGGYLGLAYATNWNSTMLKDYTRAYADIMDNDPSTKSYMDFFPPNVKEENLDKTWLTNLLKNRKDYFRRNRDLCIISIVGVYLIAMVDAYVDASLAHFDISPDLSIDWAPAVIQDGRTKLPSVGLQWAVNF